MENKIEKDLTVGNVPRTLIKFAMPIFVGNLLYSGYSIINTIWVGNLLGTESLGAVAISFPLILILIGIISGATMATSILISRFFGAKDYESANKVIRNSYTITIIGTIVLTLLGVLGSDLILKAMGTPDEIFGSASSYLKIVMLGTGLMYFYYLLTSILRGIGDTLTALIFLIISTAINAILDPIFLLGLGPIPKMGLNGAAYASLIAQFISLVLGFLYIRRKKSNLQLMPKKWEFDKVLSVTILKIGIPSIVQQLLVQIGAVFVTSMVNFYGGAAVAAFGAASRIDTLVSMPAVAMSMAIASLTGQNLGANKSENIKEVLKWGLIMTSIVTFIISIISIAIPKEILYIFVKDKEVINFGIDYLRIVGIGYVIFSSVIVVNGVINGSGKTMSTLKITVFALWIIRVPLAFILTRTSLGVKGIWVAILISFVCNLAASVYYYFSGKWKIAQQIKPQIADVS